MDVGKEDRATKLGPPTLRSPGWSLCPQGLLALRKVLHEGWEGDAGTAVCPRAGPAPSGPRCPPPVGVGRSEELRLPPHPQDRPC